MNPGRYQYTLGSSMILIAVLAVGMTVPVFSRGLVIGAAAPIALFLCVSLVQEILTPLFARAGEFLNRRFDSWSPRRPPEGE